MVTIRMMMAKLSKRTSAVDARDVPGADAGGYVTGTRTSGSDDAPLLEAVAPVTPGLAPPDPSGAFEGIGVELA